jgi:hypothetical protein
MRRRLSESLSIMGNRAARVGIIMATDEKWLTNEIPDVVETKPSAAVDEQCEDSLKLLPTASDDVKFVLEDVRLMIKSPKLFDILSNAIEKELADSSLQCMGFRKEARLNAVADSGTASCFTNNVQDKIEKSATEELPDALAAKSCLLKILVRYYKNYDSHLSKLIAMKVISDRLQNHDGFCNALAREACKQSKHPRNSFSVPDLQDMVVYGEKAVNNSNRETSICSNSSSFSLSRRSLFNTTETAEKRNSGISPSATRLGTLEETPVPKPAKTVADMVLDTIKAPSQPLKDLCNISWVRLLSMVFDDLPLGITLITTSKRLKQQYQILHANRIFQNLVRCQRKACVGRQLKEFHGPNTHPEHVISLQRALTNGDSAYIPGMVSYSHLGVEFTETVITKPIRDQEGRYRYCVVIHVSHQYLHFPLMLQFAKEIAYFLPETIIEY